MWILDPVFLQFDLEWVIIMQKIFGLVSALALFVGVGPAFAERTDIVVGMQLEPPHLDPTSAAAGAIDYVVYSNVFEGLTRFASNGSVIPGLAKSWEISDDNLTYTFNLRDGVTFHDGSTMNAEDVKFSLDRARAEDSTNAQKALFTDIATVDVMDDVTVQVTLSQQNGNFLFNMAWGDAVIVAPETIGDVKTTPIGTGAFQFSNWVQGDSIELVRNDAYWGTPAKLENLTYKFISEPTAAFASLMAEDVDAFVVYPALENLVQFDADPRFKVLVGQTEGETILSINNSRPPLNNVKVRKAIAHAIDRQSIIDGAMFGYGTPIGSHFAPHNPAYIDLTGNSTFDPELSKSLLAEAGLVDGFKITLKLPPVSYARRGGEIIASQLKDIGIEAEIINVEWAQWLEGPFRGSDFDLTIVSHTEPMDIGIYARPDYYFNYQNPVFNTLMKDLNATTDTDMRTEMLKKAQSILSEDYVNGFLFQLAQTSVVNTKIEGVWENAPTQAIDMTAVYWTE